MTEIRSSRECRQVETEHRVLDELEVQWSQHDKEVLLTFILPQLMNRALEMRRTGMTLLSLLFSVLALVGGAQGAMLCLHEAGIFHVSAFPKAEHNSAANDKGDAGDACDTDSIDRCDWCVDLEVKGLDLAEVRFDDGEEVFVITPVFVATIPSQEWEVPTAISFSFPLARAPPALPQALIVVRKTVLLI